jgi:hypothetical protein
VRVRAIAEPCLAWGSPHDALHCHMVEPHLLDAAEPDLVTPLPLTTVAPGTLLTALRRLPLINRLLLPGPELVWEMVRIYRVRLQRTVGGRCSSADCFAAALLAIAP